MKNLLIVLILFIICMNFIDCENLVKYDKGIIEVKTNQNDEWLPLCQNNVDQFIANLICQSTQQTNAKDIQFNKKCQPATVLENSQSLQFYQFQQKMTISTGCLKDYNKGILNDFNTCIDRQYQDQFTLSNQNCSVDSCVSIECYSQTEYKKKVEEVPAGEEYEMMQKDNLLSIYLGDEEGWQYMSHRDLDLEDKFDKNVGDILCKKLGYSTIKSITRQPCNFKEHLFIQSVKLVGVWCGCICDEILEDCDVSDYQKNWTYSDNCTNLQCEPGMDSSTLVIIIVASSVVFVFIVVVIICKCCRKKQTNPNVKKVETSQPQKPQPTVFTGQVDFQMNKSKNSSQNSIENNNNNNNTNVNVNYGNQWQQQNNQNPQEFNNNYNVNTWQQPQQPQFIMDPQQQQQNDNNNQFKGQYF